MGNLTSGRILDACRSISFIDLGNFEDFRTALKANLIASKEDEPVFDALFQMFFHPEDEWWDAWQEAGQQENLGSVDESDLPESLKQQISQLIEELEGEQAEQIPEDSDGPSYSAVEVITNRDFAEFYGKDLKEIRRVIARLAPKLATAISRRTKVTTRGSTIDLRRTFRHNLRYGGEVLRLARRRRKIKKLRLVLLCDVSGSMDVYSKFLIQFVYGLENELTGVDAWVFTTHLTDITPILLYRSFDDAMRQMGDVVRDWSGGTSIGGSLWEFVSGPSKRKINGRSVVIIISDGWDRGDTRVLDQAMRTIKKRAFKVIWMNPLAGSPKYQPICAGMKTAMPYVDFFLPAHNLDSLIRLGKTLNSLAQAL
ncbi:MAG: VWA domain-containing protein [Chloroflexi bacterium]|nr:VWA domain-containing protein [Chloroflexota bacterium]